MIRIDPRRNPTYRAPTWIVAAVWSFPCDDFFSQHTHDRFIYSFALFSVALAHNALSNHLLFPDRQSTSA
ncbi:hypothetical protein Y032_0002g672 [Ancylostoma ceylanicum]|uniref:Uncharacterized protein n=1 Tax=Ancylostoma ceylanicum TaxID=53326 RepID=A0A016W1Q3_9BILA|nr:hypothetical protein Y032_0002g672 [Ancylostoma ceylanicum]